MVGFNWKGKNVQRALNPNGNHSNTKEQQLHRARFALITRVGGDLYEAIYEGYRHEANKQATTKNGLFVKDNIRVSVIGNAPESLALDYEKLQLSCGNLKGVDFGEASISGNVLSVAISDNNLYGRRVSISDRIYLVAYCPELGDACCQSVGIRNGESSLTLSLPAKWNGKRVYAYGFVVGAASFNEGLASKTEYLGAFGDGASTPSSGSGTGSGSGSVTVQAPTISGTTPFAETTQVSISASDGARIYYTTNGSTPTSESTLYSAAFTLSDTSVVKAIAIMGGQTSEVASKTFTKSDDDTGEND